ncbi:hypothetical protein V6N12_045699 [Hibiscus sabdariffa]|uniref:Uncharacterized protein n=1 Tax=Hibiscus sabdariffa TaxID=183260 RepID=A0ABR2G3T2_9ROSI
MELYCDNNGAIAQAKEPRSHQWSKHILRRFHLIREIINRGYVEICKVHTDDNIADPLTNLLAQHKHDRHTESLGIRYNKSLNPKFPIGSRSLTHQEVREFVKKICSRFAAYQGSQCGFPNDIEVAKGDTHEQCKAISTRSGKVLEPMNKQRGTTVTPTKTSTVTDTLATADIPAKADEDHIDPTETREVGSAVEASQPE